MTFSVVVDYFKSFIPLYAAFLEETVSYLPGLEILWSALNATFYLRLYEKNSFLGSVLSHRNSFHTFTQL
jgi:hypothetical protein